VKILKTDSDIYIHYANKDFFTIQVEFTKCSDQDLSVCPETLSELFRLFGGQEVHPNILKQLTGGRPLFLSYGYDRVGSNWQEVRKLIPEGTLWDSFDSGNGEYARRYEKPLKFIAGLERFPDKLEQQVQTIFLKHLT